MPDLSEWQLIRCLRTGDSGYSARIIVEMGEAWIEPLAGRAHLQVVLSSREEGLDIPGAFVIKGDTFRDPRSLLRVHGDLLLRMVLHIPAKKKGVSDTEGNGINNGTGMAKICTEFSRMTLMYPEKDTVSALTGLERRPSHMRKGGTSRGYGNASWLTAWRGKKG